MAATMCEGGQMLVCVSICGSPLLYKFISKFYKLQKNYVREHVCDQFFLVECFLQLAKILKIKSRVTHSEDFCEKSAPKSPKFEGKMSGFTIFRPVVFSLRWDFATCWPKRKTWARWLLQNILGWKSLKFTIFQGKEAWIPIFRPYFLARR